VPQINSQAEPAATSKRKGILAPFVDDLSVLEAACMAGYISEKEKVSIDK
jgi:hypothetical protein